MCPIRPGTRSHYITQAAFEPEIILPQPSDAEMVSYFLSGMFFICPRLDVPVDRAVNPGGMLPKPRPSAAASPLSPQMLGKAPGEQVHTVRA